jgi:hypothetical protein
MALYAMWVPGSSALVQQGMSSHAFLGGGQYWSRQGESTGFITANIATPVIVNGRRTHLTKVYVLYRTDTAASGSNPSVPLEVSVYDGPALLGKRKNWASGDYSNGLFPENVLDLPDRPSVRFGIQIGLEFGSGNSGSSAGIVCYGFGAHFDDADVPTPILARTGDGGGARPV